MSTILDTMPKGSGGGGGLSREEMVDRICEDLLAKVRPARVRGRSAWGAGRDAREAHSHSPCSPPLQGSGCDIAALVANTATNASPALPAHPGPQVPPLFDREEMRERLRKLPGGATQPLTVHLRQEIDRLNVVLATTKATLTDLRLAISGGGAWPGLGRLSALWVSRGMQLSMARRW